jgi:hypothetical protein
MNVYTGHKHFPSDIIGLESVVLTAGNIGSVPASGYVSFLATSDLNGYNTTSSRSDHRHNNILSYPTTGNLLIDNSDGIYSIAINNILSNLVLDRTNTLNIDASKFTLYNSPTGTAKFDIETLTGDRVYQFPNTSGTIVLSSTLGDGSDIPSIGQTPPDIPRILLSQCTSAFNSGSKTSSISVAIGNPVGSILLRNVIGFTIYYKQKNTLIWNNQYFSYSLSAGAGTQGSFIALFTVSGLIPGEVYEFTVDAKNAFLAQSLKSTIIEITSAASTVAPALPLNLTTLYLGTIGSYAKVRVDWSQNLEDDILEYRLYRSTTINPPAQISGNNFYTGVRNSCSADFNTSTPHYYILLVVVNKSGLISTQTTDLLLPTSPADPIISSQNITTSINGNGSCIINVSFNDSSVSSGNFPYVFTLKKGNDPESIKTFYGTTAKAFTFIDLIPNTSYTINVGFITPINVYSGLVLLGTITTAADTTPPSQPTNFNYNLFYSSVNFTWSKNTELDFSTYKLYLSDAATGCSITEDNRKYTGSVNSFLTPITRGATTWYAKLVAIDTSGNVSTPASASFSFDQRPPRPTHNNLDITSSQITGSVVVDDLGQVAAYIKISFSDTQRDGYGYYEYQIYKNIGEEQYFTAPTPIYPATSSFTFLVLPNTTYNVNTRYVDSTQNKSVWAVNGGIVVSTPKNNIPPNPPTGLTARSGFGSVILKWNNPTNKDLKYVDVYRYTTNNSAVAEVVAHVSGNTYSDVGLSAGDTFYYWTKAVNTSDLSSVFSNVASGTTIQLLPAELDTKARVDFIVRDLIFQFKHIESGQASTTLDYLPQAGSAGIIFEDILYAVSTSGSILNAQNSYIIATLTKSPNIASFSASAFSSSLPNLNKNQIIIALTSAQPFTETNNYACYVRQANSMALEGAIIREATITTAKIKNLDAAVVSAVQVNAGSILISGSGGAQTSLSTIKDKAVAATRNVWRGAWSSTASYVVGDEVSYVNSSYGCILDHTSTLSTAPPTGADTNTWWSVRSKAAAGGATGATGLAALTVNLSNSSQNIQTDADGLNGVYTGTGTTITLSEGAVDLDYDGSGANNGRWAISINSVNITAGAITDSGTYVTVADASNIIADTAYISFSLSGRRLSGESFTIRKDQTFNRIKAPVMYDVKVLSSAGNIFRIGDAKTTVLSAHVFRNGVEVTDEPYMIPDRFKWERISYYPDPVGDAAWNAAFARGPKYISITIDSVNTMATFFCTITS